jgi:hypothetical protein
MTVEQLKAYARAALIARLEALDREQRDLRALLARFTDERTSAAQEDTPGDAATPLPPPRASRTISAEGRQRIGDAARRRWAAVRDARGDATAAAPEPDVARVLPRRGRSHRVREHDGASAPAVPALPPMPRLIKAQAS